MFDTEEEMTGIERELAELAGHLNAATCRFLLVLADYDAAGGWASWGARSCAAWLSWRCGIAPGAAREQVRVARRLASLPLLTESFGCGELSYSKMRALTRLEAVEDEEGLLMYARHATAAQLERMVRGYRACAVHALGADAAGARYVTHREQDDGTVEIRARLPADEAALVLAAIDAARARLDAAEWLEAVDDGRSPAGSATSPAGDAPEHVSAETSAEADGRPRASAADALVHVADGFLAATATDRTGGDRYQVVVHVDVAALDDSDPAARCELDDGAPLPFETARRLCCDASLVRIVERDGHPLSVGRKTRSIPPSLRRALRARDRCCRFPGCTQRRHLDAHHVRHWSRGGRTDLDNLVHLCAFHHRLVHEGGYSMARDPGGSVRFCRPDGRRLGAGGIRTRGDVHELRAEHRRAGRRIDVSTAASLSHDRFDLGLAVDGLLGMAPVERAHGDVSAEIPPE